MNLFLSLLFFYWTYGYKITSPDHNFFNDKQDYVINQNIIPGSRLLNKDGETIEVCNVAKKNTITEVYDLLTQDGEYSAGESGVMSGTRILRFLAENKVEYKTLYDNYKLLDKTNRAKLVRDMYLFQKSTGNLFDFAEEINKVNGLKAWQALRYESYLVRTQPHVIETVARHIDETGKSEVQISDEMVASRSYDDWLVDYFVTYEKNGYILDKASIDYRFTTHLEQVDGLISGNSAPACHNRVEFLKEVFDPITAPNKRVVILNEIPKGLNGWTEIIYKTYKVDASQNLILPLEFNAGPSNVKTVYNPSIINANDGKRSGYNSFKNTIDNPTTNIGFGNKPNSFRGLSNSKYYTGFS